MRKAGILLAISSLPSRHGIGDFGETSYAFIRRLKKAHMKIWQILPLNPLGYGNSPYQPYSSKAMEESYISLDILKKEGLISHAPDFNADSQYVDYVAVRAFKRPYLEEAFKNFKRNDEYIQFSRLKWVYEYAVFRTLKRHNDEKMWLEWPLDQQKWIHNHEYDLSAYKDEIDLEIFIQYQLVSQWLSLKQYAAKQGIELVGDLPIYVGIDSLDVWANQDSFLLDDKSHPTFIAGVPPDYFSPTGQRWGNPLYDWQKMRQNHFSFWIDRLSYCAMLFDHVRIDHFRAFDTYWKIPVECPTAVDGEWVEAPGYEFFDTVFSRIENISIIAEDLGDLREEVLELRDHYKLPGMKVVQFEFDGKTCQGDKENCIAYTGTHDNQTIKEWYKAQSSAFKARSSRTFKKLGIEYRKASEKMLAYTCLLKANWAILPMQDILDLGDEARMNIPSTIGSPNWQWRMQDFKSFDQRINFLKELVNKSKR